MKKIGFILLLMSMFITSILFADNPSKEINNKCRQNLKLLNSATAEMLKEKGQEIHSWTSMTQFNKMFLDFNKFLDIKKIVGPTPSCEYYLVYLSKDDYQWLCNLHGVLDGNHTLSLKYHEYQLQGKTCDRYKSIKEYEKHTKEMLTWTEYTLTPKEFFKYQYNTNPIMTTVITIVLVIVSFALLKSFFKF